MTRPQSAFALANQQRSASAAKRRVSESRRAFRTLKKHADHPAARRYPEQYVNLLNALSARIDHPTGSLAEIAAGLGVTKHTYSSRLRRAIEFATWFDNNGRRTPA